MRCAPSARRAPPHPPAGRLAAALAALLATAVPARAESLVVSLSVSRLAITANYAGAAVAIFGAVERDGQSVSRAGRYEVVVTVRGPGQTLTVREKETVGPIWLNRAQRKFADVPAYLAVLSSGPLAEIAGETDRTRLRVGLDALVAGLDAGPPGARDAAPFRDALLRLKGRDGLFLERERAVSFLTPTIFSARLPVPATAPTGHYDVEVALFSGGAVLARTGAGFDLVKAGAEQRLAVFAREWSILYGLGVAALALAAGWIASVIFRRD